MATIEDYIAVRQGVADETTVRIVAAALNDPTSELNAILKEHESRAAEMLGWPPSEVVVDLQPEVISNSEENSMSRTILDDFCSVREGTATLEEIARVSEALHASESELRQSLKDLKERLREVIGRLRCGIWGIATIGSEITSTEITGVRPANEIETTEPSPASLSLNNRIDSLRPNVPTTARSKPSRLSWGRKIAIYGTAAASLLVGILTLFNHNGGGEADRFSVLQTRALIRSLGVRGAPNDGSSVVFHSDRDGFATLIALYKDAPPRVFPGIAFGLVPVHSGVETESLPLPERFHDAIAIIVAMTEQPSTDVVRRHLDDHQFKANEIEVMKKSLAEIIKESHYKWLAFANLQLPEN